jgi:hypothetical protein
MSKTSNATIITNCNKRLAAIKKYLANPSLEIPVNGAMVVPATIAAAFQNDLDKRAVVVTTKAAYGAAVAAAKSSGEERSVVDDALKYYVLHRFGADSAEAKEFGYSPRKKPRVSAAARAEGVKANQATRAARHTMGSKEKEKIKGTVAAPAAPAALANGQGGAGAPVAPVASAASPAPAATPATNAPGGGGHA